MNAGRTQEKEFCLFFAYFLLVIKNKLKIDWILESNV